MNNNTIHNYTIDECWLYMLQRLGQATAIHATHATHETHAPAGNMRTSRSQLMLFQVEASVIPVSTAGITCDTENTKCMQRVCTKCCYDEPNLQDHNPADTATWEQWEKQDVVVGERSYKNWVKLEIWDCKEKAIYRKDTIKDAIENMPPFMVNNIARYKSHHHHLIPWLSLKKI